MKNLITSSKTAKIRASGAFVSLNIENKLKVKYHIYVNIKQEISLVYLKNGAYIITVILC